MIKKWFYIYLHQNISREPSLRERECVYQTSGWRFMAYITFNFVLTDMQNAYCNNKYYDIYIITPCVYMYIIIRKADIDVHVNTLHCSWTAYLKDQEHHELCSPIPVCVSAYMRSRVRVCIIWSLFLSIQRCLYRLDIFANSRLRLGWPYLSYLPYTKRNASLRYRPLMKDY